MLQKPQFLVPYLSIVSWNCWIPKSGTFYVTIIPRKNIIINDVCKIEIGSQFKENNIRLKALMSWKGEDSNNNNNRWGCAFALIRLLYRTEAEKSYAQRLGFYQWRNTIGWCWYITVASGFAGSIHYCLSWLRVDFVLILKCWGLILYFLNAEDHFFTE